MTSDDNSIQIARLEEKFAAMRSDMVKMEGQLLDMTNKLDQVLAALSEAKGGWKLMMLLGGGAATFGSLITWALTHIGGKGAP